MKTSTFKLSTSQQVIFAIVLSLALLFGGCDTTNYVPLENNTSPQTKLRQQDLVGKWYQMPLNGDEKKERTLDFTDGFGTLIYPDYTGTCNGKPVLLKRFSWEEVNEGNNILQLNVFHHEECGIMKKPYEEIVFYSNHSNGTLRIFDHSWLRKTIKTHAQE